MKNLIIITLLFLLGSGLYAQTPMSVKLYNYCHKQINKEGDLQTIYSNGVLIGITDDNSKIFIRYYLKEQATDDDPIDEYKVFKIGRNTKDNTIIYLCTLINSDDLRVWRFTIYAYDVATLQTNSGQEQFIFSNSPRQIFLK